MRGIIPLNRGVIAWLEIHDGPDFRKTFYEPTDDDIRDVCCVNNLPVTEVNKKIREAASKGAYGILINIPEFKQALLEESIVHLFYGGTFGRPYCKTNENDNWVRINHTAMGKICPDCQDKLGRKIS